VSTLLLIPFRVRFLCDTRSTAYTLLWPPPIRTRRAGSQRASNTDSTPLIKSSFRHPATRFLSTLASETVRASRSLTCFRFYMTSRWPNICHHDAPVRVHSYWHQPTNFPVNWRVLGRHLSTTPDSACRAHNVRTLRALGRQPRRWLMLSEMTRKLSSRCILGTRQARFFVPPTPAYHP
jgi:hypothetical protein